MGKYHSKGGLYFERMPDGRVNVTIEDALPLRDGLRGSVVVRQVTLDANTWASAVASVSAHGEDVATFLEALDFHNNSEGI